MLTGITEVTPEFNTLRPYTPRDRYRIPCLPDARSTSSDRSRAEAPSEQRVSGSPCSSGWRWARPASRARPMSGRISESHQWLRCARLAFNHDLHQLALSPSHSERRRPQMASPRRVHTVQRRGLTGGGCDLPPSGPGLSFEPIQMDH